MDPIERWARPRPPRRLPAGLRELSYPLVYDGEQVVELYLAGLHAKAVDADGGMPVPFGIEVHPSEDPNLDQGRHVAAHDEVGPQALHLRIQRFGLAQ